MAALGLHQVKEENSAFMTCVLRVNVSSSGWQKVVARVVKNTNGLTNFRMNEEGMVEVSGTVDPNLLLKTLAKAGKRAEVCWFQFGQCSSNLYMPPDHNDYYDYGHNGYCGNYGSHGYGGLGYNGGYGENNYYSDHRYLHYRGYGNRPRPRISYRVGPSSPPLADEGVSCCSLM